MGYSNPTLTAARGVSAGGLAVASVCNRSPALLQAAVLKVIAKLSSSYYYCDQ